MPDTVMHVLLSPADDVADLDEWYARLDSAVSVSNDARWHAESSGLAAELPDREAAEVVERAQAALGDAVVIEREEAGGSVLVSEVAGGRPIDE